MRLVISMKKKTERKEGMKEGIKGEGNYGIRRMKREKERNKREEGRSKGRR